MNVSSFVFYTSSKELIDKLSDEQAGVLFKTILAYTTDCDVKEMDLATEITFTSIKQYLDENYKKRQKKAEKNRENGSKGGRPRKATNDDANASKSIQKDANADNEEPVEIVTDDSHRTPYQDVVNMYHEICVSLPTVRAVSDSRRKLIRSRYNQYGIDEIRTVFEKAEASDFLTGRSENSWRCGFDWLLNPSNFLKVLEGNYDNKGSHSPNDPYQGSGNDFLDMLKEEDYT